MKDEIEKLNTMIEKLRVSIPYLVYIMLILWPLASLYP